MAEECRAQVGVRVNVLAPKATGLAVGVVGVLEVASIGGARDLGA